MGLIGLLMIFVSRKAQRMGDLMAQTMVIHETPIDWSIFDEVESSSGKPAVPAARPAIGLGSQQWELLHRFLNRRDQFEPGARERLARSVCESLRPATQGTDLALSTLEPEAWLVALARRT
jgi:hypothetical protein